jgi:hypothetical protein
MAKAMFESSSAGLLKLGGYGQGGRVLLRANMVEAERKVGQGHLSDLYRDAEMHRLLLASQIGVRRTRLDLTRPAAWTAVKLQAAGMLLRQRFISPCGQFTFWKALPDC